MRIIRDNDPHDDDNDRRREPGPLGELVAGIPAEQVPDILGDEFEAFLAAATAAADGAPFPLGQDAPVEPAAPRPVKTVLRAATTDTDAPPVPVSAARRAGLRPRLLRAGLGGSAAVLAAAVLAAWAQPAVVAAPIAVYGLGWMAYLWWNAALRPPIPQVLVVIVTAISRGIAAVARGLAGTARRVVGNAEDARSRHESHRTTTA